MSLRDALQSGAERIASIVRKRFPALTYGGHHTYRVVSVTAAGRMDLDPVEPDMDSIPAVDQWTASGFTGLPAVGSLVLVVFRDCRPDRPAVVAMQAHRIDGGVPTKALIDASGTVELGGAGAAFLAHAAEVTSNLSTLKSAISGAVIVAGDGGASLKSTLMAALGAFPAALATTKAKGV